MSVFTSIYINTPTDFTKAFLTQDLGICDLQICQDLCVNHKV